MSNKQDLTVDVLNTETINYCFPLKKNSITNKERGKEVLPWLCERIPLFFGDMLENLTATDSQSKKVIACLCIIGKGRKKCGKTLTKWYT